MTNFCFPLNDKKATRKTVYRYFIISSTTSQKKITRKTKNFNKTKYRK